MAEGAPEPQAALETLRALAEERLSTLPGEEPIAESLTAADLTQLLYELRVHQTELEMQNEELRRLQADLEAMRDRYADLYDFAPVGYLTLDRQKRIVEANVACAQLFGIERRDLPGQLFTLCLHESDRQTFADYCRRIFDARGRRSCELRLAPRPGRAPCWVRLEASVVYNGETRPRWCRLVLMDVSERRRQEQALRDADARKDEFLAMLAHELRNPLAPIRSASEILRLLPVDEPRVGQMQAIIDRQVTHLTRLVDDLLDVSRIVRDKITLRHEGLPLDQLFDEAIAATQDVLERKGQRLVVRRPETAAHLWGDRVRLVQMLVNLLDNAAKYSPDGSEIALEAEVQGGRLLLRVRDQGMGIPATLLPHIFDVFQQGERDMARTHGGLGLGLTLVKRLALLHGGDVEAYSAGEDQGATLTLRLPRLAESAPDSTTPIQTASAPAALRILVVDDEPDQLTALQLLLESLGHQVRVSGSGEQAIPAARDWRPNLVLLDIGMPGMSGYETAATLRRLPDGDTLYLAAVSGYGDAAARARGRLAGFDHHLVKPVPTSALEALIAEIKPRAGN